MLRLVIAREREMLNVPIYFKRIIFLSLRFCSYSYQRGFGLTEEGRKKMEAKRKHVTRNAFILENKCVLFVYSNL